MIGLRLMLMLAEINRQMFFFLKLLLLSEDLHNKYDVMEKFSPSADTAKLTFKSR